MSKLTEEKKIEINVCIELLKKLDEYFDILTTLTGINSDSPLFNLVFKLVDLYLANLSSTIYDGDELLSWYCYDNAFGNSELSLFDDDSNEYIIASLDDLFKYIEQINE